MIPDAFNPESTGADRLISGYYLLRRDRQGRVPLPVRIWFGPPVDDNGQELDRAARWQVTVAGQLLDGDEVQIGRTVITALSDIWPQVASHPSSKADYEYRMAVADWAAEHDPNDPRGDPAARIDPLTASLPPMPEDVE